MARDRGAMRARRQGRGNRPWVVGPVALTLIAQLSTVVVALVAGLSAALTLLIVVIIGVVGAALARRTVASLVAGAGIRVAQPYVAGERIRLYVPALDAVQDAEIVRVGPVHTTVLTSAGLCQVPNTRMLLGTRR